MQIFIKTLSDRLIPLEVNSTDIIGDLKKKICDMTNMPVTSRLILNHQRLDEKQTVGDSKITVNCTIHVVYRSFAPSNHKWKPFIKSLSIEPLTQNVSLNNLVFSITFQQVEEKKIHLDTIVDLRYHDSNFRFGMQNIWERYLSETHGPKKAASFFWSEMHCYSRLILVKLRQEFIEKGENIQMLKYIDQQKYDNEGINHSYYGGDSRSWQRYTIENPVKGIIEINKNEETIRFKSSESLSPNTWYALILLHNNHEYPDYIYEDFLIPFKTIESNQIKDKTIESNQIKDIDNIPEQFICCICLNNTKKILFNPCNHLITCDGCAEKVNNICPKCRSTITNKITVFY